MDLKYFYSFITIITALLSNISASEIIKNKAYSWVGDTIRQGEFYAWANNDYHIITTYKGKPGYYMSGEKEWKVKNDLTSLPHLSSSNTLYNAIYNMGLDEMKANIQADTTFKAGKGWKGVWTRDISYSILLSLAYLEPTATKISLIKKVSPTGRIIQDKGSGGSWPISSDRMIWALAAYELYKVTGDHEWLEYIYPIIANSIEADLNNIKSETGLIRGETSFIDWRNQSYPQWMETVDIYKSESLNTSIVHFQALKIQASIARELGKYNDAEKYEKYSENIKKAINEYLWIENKGYYAMYRYGRNSMIVNSRIETLGESLAILFGVASKEQAQKITESNPTTSFGVGVFYPQIKFMNPYHNSALWPFVASYWAWANSKVGNEEGTLQAIGSIIRPAALFATNKENLCLDNGDFATVLNSSQQLWSIAGNLAITHRILFGMNFDIDGIRFTPFIPKKLSDKRILSNFHYRNALLKITIEGYGNRIKIFKINGKNSKPFIPANMYGNVDVYIEMDNNEILPLKVNMSKNTETPQTPETRIVKYSNQFYIEWNPIEDIAGFKVIKNGEIIDHIRSIEYKLTEPGEYQVIAIDKKGNESFASEPLMFYKSYICNMKNENIKVNSKEICNYDSSISINGYWGNGFVETDHKNKMITSTISIPMNGEYILCVRYANGNGPVNSGNSAAIRTLFVDGKKIDVLVMPHRGAGNWSEWGMSNYISANLTKGKHNIIIDFLPDNENMNLKTNHALIDAIIIYNKSLPSN